MSIFLRILGRNIGTMKEIEILEKIFIVWDICYMNEFN